MTWTRANIFFYLKLFNINSSSFVLGHDRTVKQSQKWVGAHLFLLEEQHKQFNNFLPALSLVNNKVNCVPVPVAKHGMAGVFITIWTIILVILSCFLIIACSPSIICIILAGVFFWSSFTYFLFKHAKATQHWKKQASKWCPPLQSLGWHDHTIRCSNLLLLFSWENVQIKAQ